MKVRVTCKCNDALSNAEGGMVASGANRDQLDEFYDLAMEYFMYGEYLYVDIDLKNGTVELVPCE